MSTLLLYSFQWRHIPPCAASPVLPSSTRHVTHPFWDLWFSPKRVIIAWWRPKVLIRAFNFQECLWFQKNFYMSQIRIIELLQAWKNQILPKSEFYPMKFQSENMNMCLDSGDQYSKLSFCKHSQRLFGQLATSQLILRSALGKDIFKVNIIKWGEKHLLFGIAAFKTL